MAETTPLTDEERAELEQLRAEKAARAEAQRAAAERAELERLKAERSAAERDAEAIAHEAELRERGRALMEPDDDDLGMPTGQKIVLGVIVTMAVAVLFIQFFL